MDMELMSIEEIENFLKRVEAASIEHWIGKLSELFISDVRAKDRNKIALILSEYGKNLAVEPIITMLKNPKTQGFRGTLLYALEDLDCSSHLDFLFTLMMESNFEVSRQSYLIIEKMLLKNNDDLGLIKKQIPILTEKIRTLQEEIDFYVSALELLSK